MSWLTYADVCAGMIYRLPEGERLKWIAIARKEFAALLAGSSNTWLSRKTLDKALEVSGGDPLVLDSSGKATSEEMQAQIEQATRDSYVLQARRYYRLIGDLTVNSIEPLSMLQGMIGRGEVALRDLNPTNTEEGIAEELDQALVRYSLQEATVEYRALSNPFDNPEAFYVISNVLRIFAEAGVSLARLDVTGRKSDTTILAELRAQARGSLIAKARSHFADLLAGGSPTEMVELELATLPGMLDKGAEAIFDSKSIEIARTALDKVGRTLARLNTGQAATYEDDPLATVSLIRTLLNLADVSAAALYPNGETSREAAEEQLTRLALRARLPRPPSQASEPEQ